MFTNGRKQESINETRARLNLSGFQWYETGLYLNISVFFWMKFAINKISGTI